MIKIVSIRCHEKNKQKHDYVYNIYTYICIYLHVYTDILFVQRLKKNKTICTIYLQTLSIYYK